MLFKDLNVGDVFKLIKGEVALIKLSTVNDNEYPLKRYYNYPNNIFIIDKQHYGVLSPMAEVYLIKEFHGKAQEKTPLFKEYLEKHKSDIHKQNFMTYGGVPYDKISKDALHYAEADVRNTMAFLELCQEYQKVSFPGMKKVIFNDPATIVIWGDGTKTVVKCQDGERFDPEKGLALCFMKKACGNKSNFNNSFKEWIKPETTAIYDEAHPELDIQDLPTKHAISSTKDTKGGRRLVRFTKRQIADIVKAIPSYKLLAYKSRLSVASVKKALCGEPVTLLTSNKIKSVMGWKITSRN